MITIGNRPVLASFSGLLVPDGEVLKIDLSSLITNIKAYVEFSNNGGEPGLDFAPTQAGDGFKLTVRNWVSPVGTSTKEPVTVMQLVQGGTLDVMLISFRQTDSNFLSIQFLRGS